MYLLIPTYLAEYPDAPTGTTSVEGVIGCFDEAAGEFSAANGVVALFVIFFLWFLGVFTTYCIAPRKAASRQLPGGG